MAQVAYNPYKKRDIPERGNLYRPDNMVIWEDVFYGLLLRESHGNRTITLVRVRQHDIEPSRELPRHKAVVYHRLKKARKLLAFARGASAGGAADRASCGWLDYGALQTVRCKAGLGASGCCKRWRVCASGWRALGASSCSVQHQRGEARSGPHPAANKAEAPREGEQALQTQSAEAAPSSRHVQAVGATIDADSRNRSAESCMREGGRPYFCGRYGCRCFLA